MLDNVKVVKRDGKKVDFNGTKIAIAIKKGFDSVNSEKSDSKYTENDVNKIYNLVIDEIEKLNPEKIKIEEIQDLIEEKLRVKGYEDVYKSFTEYRERRAQARKIFFEEKKQHRFLKALETLTMEESSEKHDVRSPYEIMVDYGNTISSEFAKAYVIKKRYADSIDSGEIYIHDLNYVPIGTTSSTQIDIEKLFTGGYYAENIRIREPKDIMSYSALAIQALTLNQKEQFGCQSIPLFDYYMAPGVIKTFKKQFKQTIDNLMEYSDFGIFAATNGIDREIDKLETIDFDIEIFDKYSRDADTVKRLLRVAKKLAMEKTEKAVGQAMEAFVHDVNVLNTIGIKKENIPTINLGTDTSPEGRIIIDKLLYAIDYSVDKNMDLNAPVVIFKVKDGVNFKEGDPNYDLYKKAIDISSRKKFPMFSFLDSTYNGKKYDKNNKNTEAAYDASYVRVYDNYIDEDKDGPVSRCLLSTTTINLPRIAIRSSKILNIRESYGKDNEDFFNELDEKMDFVKDQLLDRFEVQGNKKAYEFPFLIEQGVLNDGEKAKEEDKVRKIIKQGILNIGFVGLEEAIFALTGKNRLEDKEAEKLGLKIIKFMRNKVEEYSTKYNLNFCLIGDDNVLPAEDFMNMDKSIFGKIKGITDKEKYTNSFYLGKELKASKDSKIEIESKYHELTNGGHVLKIDEKYKNPEELENDLKKIKEKNIGLVFVNVIK